jgi:cellulose biosynthesis protein BcsQ
MATSLALQGKRVAMIDADPQRNLSTFFFIDEEAYKCDPNTKMKTEDSKPKQAIQLTAGQQSVLDLVKANMFASSSAAAASARLDPAGAASWDHTSFTSSAVTSVATSHPLDDFTTPNLFTALRHAQTVSRSNWNPEELKLQQVHVQPQTLIEAGANKDQFALFLLPGHNQVVELERYFSGARLDLSSGAPLWPGPSIRMMHSFKGLLKYLCDRYQLDFIFVDMSPSSGVLNEILAMNCDYILPPTFADRFSLSSAQGFLHYIFLQWMERSQRDQALMVRYIGTSELEEKEKIAIRDSSSSIPFILPFMLTAYDSFRSPEHTILWEQLRELRSWSANLPSMSDKDIRLACANRRTDKHLDSLQSQLRSKTINAAASKWVYQLEKVILAAPEATTVRPSGGAWEDTTKER